MTSNPPSTWQPRFGCRLQLLPLRLLPGQETRAHQLRLCFRQHHRCHEVARHIPTSRNPGSFGIPPDALPEGICLFLINSFSDEFVESRKLLCILSKGAFIFNAYVSWITMPRKSALLRRASILGRAIFRKLLRARRALRMSRPARVVPRLARRQESSRLL